MHTVGFSAVIFIPLIMLALYVNKLIANIKQIYKQLLKALKDPETVLNPALAEEHLNHDSDQEKTFIDHRTLANAPSGYAFGTRRTNKTNRADSADNSDNSSHNNSSDDSNGGKSGRYAPLFGRYYFHRAIPVLRNLWRYRRYRQPDVRRRENRWKDRYVRDYPLRYYRAKAEMCALRVLVATLACLGSEKHRRARARNNRRRRKIKREEGSSSSMTTSGSGTESSASSTGGDRRVERKDFARRGGVKSKGVKRKKSLGSGYWRPGSGLVGNGSREDVMGSLERWSNQTRSRGPDERGQMGMAAERTGKREKLGWLRMRKRGTLKEVADEEKMIGDSVRD